MRVVVRPEALARLPPAERAAAEAELRELEELGKANPLAFYRPHAKQHLFHASTDPLKLLLGGNRCLAAGTLVRMADGSTKPIESIEPGERVVGSDADGNCRPTTVLRRFDNGQRPVWRFRFGKRETEEFVLATDDHEVAARHEKHTAGGKVTLGEIAKPRTRSRWSIQRSTGFAAETRGEHEDFALIAGLMLGDGCTTQPGKLQFTCADDAIRDLAREAVERHGCRLWRNEANPIQHLIFRADPPPDPRCEHTGRIAAGPRHHPLRDALDDMGVIGAYSHEKAIPPQTCRWSNEAVANLVAGLILTDGSIWQAREGWRLAYTSTSRALTDGLRRLLAERFGVYGSQLACQERERDGATRRPEWSFTVGNYASLARLHDAIPLVGSKAEKLRRAVETWEGKRSDGARLRYRDREFVGEVPTHDLLVDHPNHMFVLANGMVVSNSGKTTAGIVDSLVQALPASALPDHLRQYKRWQPPFFCRVVVPDLGSTLEGVTLQKIREWCPPAELSGGNFDNAWDSKLRLLRFRCGSWFQFLSNDQDLNKFGGAALHRVLYDEEPREDIRRECLFRLIDYDGDELFTMTPQWGLCVDTETECLTKRGWLRHDELRDTDILLSYNIERGVTEWTPLRGVYRNEHYDGPMLRTVGHLEAVFTPEHRWVTPSGLREFRELKRADKVIVSAPHQNVNESTFSPELMEIIGWVLSEGSVLPNENKVAIYQSVSRYPQHCARIEALLKACSAQYHSADRSYPTRSADGTVRRFVVTGEVARKIRWLVGYPKKLRPELIASLDPECVRALLTGLLDGDGHLRRHGTWEFTSREKDLCDGVAMLSVLIGRRTTMVTYRSPQGKPVWRTRSSAGRSAIHEFQKRARECPAPSGGVWCPSTDNGTFVARRNGRAFITGNSWVYDEIFEPWEQGRLDGCTIITVGLDDNPHLSAAGKARAIAGVSVEERQAREKGRFVHFAGPIYPEFDRTRHVIPEIAEVPETATVIAGIDPGIGRQAAVVFAYLGVDDVLVIFDEIAVKGATVAEICAEYHRRCEFWRVKPRWNVIDPSARNREMSTGKELAAAYARYGVYTIPGQNSQGFGFNIGKERLETDRLLVTANCVVFIRQIQKYRWRSDPRSPEGTPANRPIKQDDHTLDAARYIWASPMVTPKQPSREEPTTMKDRLLREHLKSLRRPTVSHPAGPGVFA